jgi:hypothetical protein
MTRHEPEEAAEKVRDGENAIASSGTRTLPGIDRRIACSIGNL